MQGNNRWILGTDKTKMEGKMRDRALQLFATIFAAGLLACSGSGGTGALEGAVEAPGSSLSNQAGPVERPPVTVDSGPQGGCPQVCKDPAAFPSSDDIPDVCRELWEDPRDLCGINLPRYEPAQNPQYTPPDLPQVLRPQVDCSEYLVADGGYHPEAVPSLCREAYERWWFRTQLREVPELRQPELGLPIHSLPSSF
ncbi:MAG: hypothetical protein IT572_01565 [Deltaproteobacteria bacterium]|nr:hypothetical protein [Deltaproteobacteria bacterium]